MDSFWLNVRLAFRSMLKNKKVTFVAALSLAVALAGNTMVFSLVNGLLYRPLPFEEPERLMVLGEHEQSVPSSSLDLASTANFLDWQDRQQSFSAMAGFRPLPRALTDSDQPEQVSTASVTPEFFEVMGVHPMLGRGFRVEEGGTAATQSHVVILSHRAFTKRFAAAQGVLGETLSIDGIEHTIIGVAKPDFEFLDPRIEFWTPLVIDRASLQRADRNLMVLARLRDGVAEETARAEMTVIAKDLAVQYPQANRGYVLETVNLRQQIPDSRNRILLGLIQGALVFVLLIACINIANLLLARGQNRGREMAIRSCLGADRKRLLGQLLTESFCLTLLGGIAGFLMAVGGVKAISSIMGASLPTYYLPVIDFSVLIFTLLVTLGAGLLFGLVPALQSSRFDLIEGLKDGTQAVTQSLQKRLMSKGLVVIELAAALILLGGASIMIRSFLELQQKDPGFQTENLLTLTVKLPEARYTDEASIDRGWGLLTQELSTVGGISQVASSSMLPRGPFVPKSALGLESRPINDDEAPPRVQWAAVSESYFDTLGISLMRGRFFETEDRLEAVPVAVINRAFVDRFFADEEVLGQRIFIGDIWREVVGVSGDVMHSLLVTQGAEPAVYVPMAQMPPREAHLLLRSGGVSEAQINAVRAGVSAFDPNLVPPQIQTLDDFIAQFFVGLSLIKHIMIAFGILALLLAFLGTYGVLSYSVAKRSHEIGIRLAIGANRGEVVRMFTKQGLKLAALGIAIGLPGVLVVSQLVAAAIADFVPVEPMTILGIVVLLVIVTGLASFIPAMNASRVDPVKALRSE